MTQPPNPPKRASDVGNGPTHNQLPVVPQPTLGLPVAPLDPTTALSIPPAYPVAGAGDQADPVKHPARPQRENAPLKDRTQPLRPAAAPTPLPKPAVPEWLQKSNVASDAPPASGYGQPPAPIPPPPAAWQTPAGVPPVNPAFPTNPATPIATQALPQRVPQADPAQTRVQPPVAYGATQHPAQRTPPAGVPTTRHAAAGSPPPPPKRPKSRRRGGGWFQAFAAIVLGLTVLLCLGLSVLIFQYYQIASDLPNVQNLRDQAAKFESTYIYDSAGESLYEINDPNQGRRTYVRLQDVSPYVIAATLATEDKNFWNSLGFDPVGITRAVVQNYTAGGTISGASTITQQLARALLLSPEERLQRSSTRKIREIILAAQMRATYKPDDILELYLNEIYYGNLAYGIEAAAQTYFKKSAKELNFAEATFLAGLPQSPAIYDVFQTPGRDYALSRHEDVVGLTVSLAAGCTPQSGGIKINSQGQTVCVSQQEGVAAILQIKDYDFKPLYIEATFPHWVNYVRQLIETNYGAQEIYRSGYRVYTTLNHDLQRVAEKVVSDHLLQYTEQNVTNAAAVVIDPKTGQILTMVGSDDYYDQVDGQINMALQRRQPASTIKPFTFLASFEKGWTPATLIWDVPTQFPDGANPPYIPRNYDGKFHGPVTVRTALGSSLNIPVIKALQFVGVYDNPETTDVREGLIPLIERFGVTTLDRPDFGLAVTLGAGEVNLLQWTGAYATLANAGQRVFPYAIAKIVDSNGVVVCQQPQNLLEYQTQLANPTQPQACQTPPDNWGQQVISAEHAFVMSDILADDNARYLVFHPGNALETPFGAAVKTGTTNDIRDTWTMGYTPNLAVGVWAGNADYSPMAGSLASSIVAGPIWNGIISQGFEVLDMQPEQFKTPSGVNSREICAVTGAEKSDYCINMKNPLTGETGARLEKFASNQLPVSVDLDLIGKVQVDAASGKLPSEACGFSNLQEIVVNNISDPFALSWLQNDPLGQQFAQVLQINFTLPQRPTEYCKLEDTRSTAYIAYPNEGQPVSGHLEIYGYADVQGGQFLNYQIDWAYGNAPAENAFSPLSGAIGQSFPDDGTPELLHAFDLPPTTLTEGQPITIRLRVFDQQGHFSEAKRVLQLINPNTATPEPTSEPTLTLASTDVPVPETATPEPTLPVPTDTPMAPTDTPTVVNVPTEPVATETATLLPFEPPTPTVVQPENEG